MRDALRDLVPFVRFKKRERHTWRSDTFSKVTVLKVTLLHGCFSRLLNCTNCASQRIQVYNNGTYFVLKFCCILRIAE